MLDSEKHRQLPQHHADHPAVGAAGAAVLPVGWLTPLGAAQHPLLFPAAPSTVTKPRWWDPSLPAPAVCPGSFLQPGFLPGVFLQGLWR